AKKPIKTQYHKVSDALEAGNIELAEKEFSQTAKHLDRAAARNIIHANSAARTKSRLSAKIKKIKKK
ncbi:MAG: 30S ribosomal protein S20, partial [Thermoguttaceae bacterium]